MRNEVNLIMLETKKNYLKEFPIKSERRFFDYFFKMNYSDDPSEIIVRATIADEICKNIVPSINGIICKNDKIYFSCKSEQQLYQKDVFDKEECYKCGQFVGKVHSYKFSYFGNLYNFRLDNIYFGEHLKETYNFCVKNNKISGLQKKCYLEEQKKCSNLMHSTLVYLNPNCEDILFDKEGNVYGYKFVDKMVIAFPKFELLSWKNVLDYKFKYFIEGYKEYSDYDYEEDDDMVAYYYDLMNLRCR